jgi:hypothetical protein
MTIYIDQMFNLGGAAVTTLTAMNFGTGSTAGAYSPQLSGRLLKVTCILVPQAATSLAQNARVELSQSNWKPNTALRIAIAGFGLATVPQAFAGDQATIDYACDLAVQTDWPITGQVVYPGTAPVTPQMLVMGTFSG